MSSCELRNSVVTRLMCRSEHGRPAINWVNLISSFEIANNCLAKIRVGISYFFCAVKEFHDDLTAESKNQFSIRFDCFDCKAIL